MIHSVGDAAHPLDELTRKLASSLPHIETVTVTVPPLFHQEAAREGET